MLNGHEGGPRAVFCTGLDVTEQHLLERRLAQVDRLDSVGRVAAGVAHDFGNTLAAMQLRLDRLMARPLDDAGREDLAAMQRTIARARELIAELNASGPAEAARPEPISVNIEVERALDLIGELIRDDVEVTVELTHEDPGVLLDSARVRQVLTNLAINAHDAMPDGGEMRVTTRIETVGTSRAGQLGVGCGRYVRLSVSDGGIGIDEAALPLLFDPYYTTKPPSTGTGLGLATVQGVARQAGGAITVTSEPGCGTKFDVWLPAYPMGNGSGSVDAVSVA